MTSPDTKGHQPSRSVHDFRTFMNNSTATIRNNIPGIKASIPVSIPNTARKAATACSIPAHADRVSGAGSDSAGGSASGG